MDFWIIQRLMPAQPLVYGVVEGADGESRERTLYQTYQQRGLGVRLGPALFPIFQDPWVGAFFYLAKFARCTLGVPACLAFHRS